MLYYITVLWIIHYPSHKGGRLVVKDIFSCHEFTQNIYKWNQITKISKFFPVHDRPRDTCLYGAAKGSTVLQNNTMQSAYLYIRCRLRQWRWMRAQSCYSRRGERGQVYTSMDCGTLDFDLRSNPQSYVKTLPQTPSTFVHPIPSFECLFNFVFVKNMKPSFDIWFSHNDVIQIILQNWLFFLFSIALLLINFTLKWHNSNVGSYVKELATLQRTCNLQRKSCASFVKNNFLFR